MEELGNMITGLLIGSVFGHLVMATYYADNTRSRLIWSILCILWFIGILKYVKAI
jgi:hypothetical protein